MLYSNRELFMQLENKIITSQNTCSESVVAFNTSEKRKYTAFCYILLILFAVLLITSTHFWFITGPHDTLLVLILILEHTRRMSDASPMSLQPSEECKKQGRLCRWAVKKRDVRWMAWEEKKMAWYTCLSSYDFLYLRVSIYAQL